MTARGSVEKVGSTWTSDGTLPGGGGGGYTDEQAQDAVGAMIADTSSINLTYTDATPELKAEAIFGTSAGTVAEGNHTHGGGSGDSTHTAAYGSRPAASNAGDLFLPSDGFVLERDTGAAWAPWGPLFPFAAPVDGDFSWVNQGDASTATAQGQIALLAPFNASLNLRLRVKSAPSTPYVITAYVLPPPIAATSWEYGLCFRQSSDGKIHALQAEPFSTTNGIVIWQSHKFTSATAFSANYTGQRARQGAHWLRIADNGTNRLCSVSTDGITFVQLHAIGRTDFLTADQVGFYCRAPATASGMDGVMTLLSWKQT